MLFKNNIKKNSMLIDIVILIIINIVFFYKFFFLDRFIYSTSEIISNFFPLYQYIGSCLKEGFFPLWDPYYYFDFVGVSFPGVFYPFNIIVSYIGSFLSLNNAFLLMQFNEIFHFFLASLFMYLLIKKLTGSREGSLFGAIAFAYSGFVARGMQQTVIIQTIVWFPLIFLFFIRGLEEKYRFSVFSGMALAMSFLAGYIAITFYMCFVLLIYALWNILISINSGFSIKKILRIITAASITFIVALGLAAIQLIPTWFYAEHSIRLGVSYENLVMWGSVPALYFITLLMPHFFGGAGVIHWGDRLVNPVGFWEVTFYAGIFTIFLSAIGLYINNNRRLRNIQYFLFFIFMFSIFMMMGKYSSLFGIYYALPVIPISRIPSRWGFFLDFSLAALGGIGLSYLSFPLSQNIKEKINSVVYRGLKPLSKWIVFSIFFLIIPLGIKSYWSSIGSVAHFLIFYFIILGYFVLLLKEKYKPYYARIIIVFLFIDLFLASTRINPVIPYVQPSASPESHFKDNSLISFFENDHDIYRVSGLPWPFLQGQTNKMFTLGYLGGFSYARFAEFRGEKDPMGSGGHSWFNLRPDPASQWIDFYNIKYLISSENLSNILPEKYELIANFYDSSGDFTEVGLYKNKNVFPRAYFVSDYKVIVDSKVILERMSHIDLGRTAVLEENPSFLADKESGAYKVTITKFMPLEIELEAEAKKDGLLVMSDVYYPGWSAWVDGKKTKILRANYVFRAMPLSSGMHKVRLKYSSLSVKVGLIFFCATLLILGVIFIRIFLTRRK